MDRLQSKTPVPPDVYDEAYYQQDMDTELLDQVVRSGGRDWQHWFERFYNLTKTQRNMRVLDLGSAKGEFVVYAALRGADAIGVDYSAAALKVSRFLTASCEEALVENAARPPSFIRADAKHLPFKDRTFDRVVSTALVEHLHPWEWQEAVREIRRVVKDNGQVMIATAPNRWYVRYGFAIPQLVKRCLPASLREQLFGFREIRQRYEAQDVHVNEQTPLSLRRSLEDGGFRAKVWLEPRHTLKFYQERLGLLLGLLVYFLLYLVERLLPTSYIFGNVIRSVSIPRSANERPLTKQHSSLCSRGKS